MYQASSLMKRTLKTWILTKQSCWYTVLSFELELIGAVCFGCRRSQDKWRRSRTFSTLSCLPRLTSRCWVCEKFEVLQVCNTWPSRPRHSLPRPHEMRRKTARDHTSPLHARKWGPSWKWHLVLDQDCFDSNVVNLSLVFCNRLHQRCQDLRVGAKVIHTSPLLSCYIPITCTCNAFDLNYQLELGL